MRANYLRGSDMMVNETVQTASSGEEIVEIRVENMGTGVFNILGDMIAGLVELNRFAVGRAREGVELIKEKLSKGDSSEEELSHELPLDPSLRPSATHIRRSLGDDPTPIPVEATADPEMEPVKSMDESSTR
ncbi:MAG: hypothetical protein HQL73_01550 [Magnetococcales bacterium]|nr:hypothetical protein [Magnetococcales bacterium]